jgi:hypothetical protein
MARIEFIFEAGKPTEVKASGFAGKSCLAATKAYEDLLGNRVASRTPTQEMHAVEKISAAAKG